MSKHTANVASRVIACIGLNLLFAGLLNHYANRIQPDSASLVFVANSLTFYNGANFGALSQHDDQLGGRMYPFARKHVDSISESLRNITADGVQRNFELPGIKDDSQAIIDYINQRIDGNEVVDTNGLIYNYEAGKFINRRRLVSTTSDPGYSETGFVVMRVDISNTSLGLMIAGLAIYLLAGIALLIINYPSAHFAKYTMLLASTFIMGFMYFVTKLSIDSINNWNLTTVNLCLFFPMSIMFAAFLVATWTMWVIPDLAGSELGLNVAVKCLLTLAMLLGCLFFPLGVVGLSRDVNFDAGIGLLSAGFAVGVVGGIICRIGWMQSSRAANKPISPTTAEHPEMPLGAVMTA